jgi:hypothetical protein
MTWPAVTGARRADGKAGSGAGAAPGAAGQSRGGLPGGAAAVAGGKGRAGERKAWLDRQRRLSTFARAMRARVKAVGETPPLSGGF